MAATQAPFARGDADSAPWWDALASGRLVLPKCDVCGRWSFPPGPACPHCGSPRPALRQASGLGTVYSWVVVHKAYDPAFASEVPYVIVTVDLDEGPRVVGRLLGSREGLRANAPVRALPFTAPSGTLLGFELR